MTCEHVRALSTPYVDGELPPRARGAVEAHLAECPACRAAFACERQGRAAVAACRTSLRAVAGDRLTERLTSRAGAVPRGPARQRGRLGRLPLAATLALVSASVLAYGVFSRNATLVAAQLTLDHLKCRYLVSPSKAPGAEIGVQTEAGPVRPPDRESMAAWERAYGWRASLPDEAAGAGFELVALRRCLHGQGFVAHALYRRGDHLVSLFVFPSNVQAAGVLAIMGQRAALWSNGAHTYAAVGAATPDELERFVTLTKQSARRSGL